MLMLMIIIDDDHVNYYVMSLSRGQRIKELVLVSAILCVSCIITYYFIRYSSPKTKTCYPHGYPERYDNSYQSIHIRYGGFRDS